MQLWAVHWFDTISTAFCNATPGDFARLVLVVIVAGYLIGRYTSK